MVLILWSAEILCGHFTAAEAPGVCQSFPRVFPLQRDSAGSQCHQSLWGAETFHQAERREGGWESESLLSKHCCKQVPVGLRYGTAVTWGGCGSAGCAPYQSQLLVCFSRAGKRVDKSVPECFVQTSVMKLKLLPSLSPFWEFLPCFWVTLVLKFWFIDPYVQKAVVGKTGIYAP